MSFCINCGTQITEGINYCPKCGKYLVPSYNNFGNLTIKWDGQWMLIDYKVHIWVDNCKIGRYSFKKGFEVTVPITSSQMKIGLKCTISSYQPILRMNPHKDHTLYIIFSRFAGFDYILCDKDGKRIQ